MNSVSTVIKPARIAICDVWESSQPWDFPDILASGETGEDGVSEGQRSYVAGVDGLRCVAVVSIFFCHLGLFPLGWPSVWLFFVISGFVITKSLLSDCGKDSDARTILRRFYIKRAFRILPLYLAAMLILSVVIYAVSGEFKGELAHISHLLTFTYNFFRMDSYYPGSVYWGHLWTLSVEEQFYFIYPVLLLGLGLRRLRYVLVAALVVGPLARLLASEFYGEILPANPLIDPITWRGNVIYQFSLVQFDAFSAGALVALFEHQIIASRRILQVMVLLSITAFTLYAAYYGSLMGGLTSAFRLWVFGHFSQVWIYSLANLTAATLVVATVLRAQPLDWLLTLPLLQRLGRISYGLYVWHLPIIWVAWPKTAQLIVPLSRELNAPWLLNRAMMAIVCGILTYLAAEVSYRLYEQPMMRAGKRMVGPSEILISENLIRDDHRI